MLGGASAVFCCLVVSLWGGGHALNCTAGTPCPALRPRDSRGCCPGLQGDVCGAPAGEGQEEGVFCDNVLGYSCKEENVTGGQGTCQGPYSLHVTELDSNSANLTWDDFHPAHYRNEYMLLYTRGTFKENLTDWHSHGIGERNYFKMPSLASDTWYFVKIGVWADDNFTHYANVTETIAFKTDSVTHCTRRDVTYEVGESFENNCEDRCTCLGTGGFDCTPVCPNLPELLDPERCRLERINTSCCAVRRVCSRMAGCYSNETREEYEHGTRFELGCRTCSCYDGDLVCAYPERCLRPESISCSEPQRVPVPGQCCPEWRCGNGTCEHGGETYNNGDRWRTADTCQACRCSDGEVTCLSVCEEVEPPENCARPERTRPEGTCCDIITCLPPEGSCLYEGRTYSQGSYLTNTRCELCVCKENSTVECSPKCRAVSVPRPNIFCPYPHVRKDGCCDTLWCENPTQDLVSVISNLFGTSYSPHSVTLSFMVAAEEGEQTGEEGNNPEGTGGASVKYELRYSSSDNVTSNDTSTWNKRTFDPRVVHSEDEPVTSPTQLLQTTGAIRVGRRVYVTVSGMTANTTYFLIVQVITSRVHDDGTGEITGPSGSIAVITLAEDEVDLCPPSCRSEEVVMIASPSCPRPVLEKTDDKCCPTWRCYPKEDGCHYKKHILHNGEQVREGCEQRCTCRTGNVTCSDLCEEPGPTPRPGCNLQTLPDHCCKVWMCAPMRMPVESLSVTVSVTYRGECDNQHTNFKSHFETALESFVRTTPACSAPGSQPKLQCRAIDVTVTCPMATTMTRRRRAVKNIMVDIVIKMNVSSNESSDDIKQILDATALSLADVFNGSDATMTVGTTSFTPTGSVNVSEPAADCLEGYVAVGDACIEGSVQPTTVPTTSLDVPLRAANVSSTTAILLWQRLNTDSTSYVTGLQIEYQDEYRKLDDIWNQSSRLSPSVTHHKLTRLEASRGYRARLVVLTNMDDLVRYPSVNYVEFQTKPFTGTLSLNLHLQEVNVGSTSVTIKWTPLSSAMRAETASMEVTYSRVGAGVVTGDTTGGQEWRQDLEPSASRCQISGLLEATAYSAHIALYYSNGTAAKTGAIHFVTMNKANTESLLIPLVVTAVVVFCAIAIVIITCLLWRRSRHREARETAFENKTFGIQLQNDGRTLSARP